MWNNRFFKRDENSEPNGSKDPTINQGVFYLYLIIGLQVFFVFGLMLTIMLVGSVISTPTWLLVAALAMAGSGLIYIYHKARKQFRKIKESLSRVDFSDKNYEISLLGGMLTMRVEQNPTRLLEAPSKPLLEGETVEAPSVHRVS